MGVLAVAAIALPESAFAEFPEYVLKGEFIERFTRFIDWPDSGFPSPTAPFVLCLIGEDPFGDYLARLAQERRIKDRRVLLAHLTANAQVDACQIAFISRSEKVNVAAIVARTGGKPILTIGDTPGFAQAGVLINFYRAEDFVRFEVNVDEAKRSGLKFSSQLMKLARIVGTGN